MYLDNEIDDFIFHKYGLLNLAIFRLLLQEKHVTYDNITIAMQEEKQIKKSERPQVTLDMLTALYNKNNGNAVLQNRIGTFIARLALDDREGEYARLVFSEHVVTDEKQIANAPKTPLDIVQKECLQSTDYTQKMLYCEAMLKSVKPSFRQGETLLQLIDVNAKLIFEMHKVIHPEDENAANIIIENYQNSPWTLCQLQKAFIKSCVSRNSHAEKMIIDFFVHTISAESMHNRMILDKLFNEYCDSMGNTQAPYIEFLPAGEVTNQFWESIRDEFILKLDEIYLGSIQKMFKMSDDNLRLLEDDKLISQEVRAAMLVPYQQLILELEQLQKTLGDKSTKIHSYCFTMKQSADQIFSKARQLFAEYKEFNAKKKIEHARHFTNSVVNLTMLSDADPAEYKKKLSTAALLLATESEKPKPQYQTALQTADALFNQATRRYIYPPSHGAAPVSVPIRVRSNSIFQRIRTLGSTGGSPVVTPKSRK